MSPDRPSAVDVRERPRYPVAEAARYVDLPPATVRYWVKGRRPRPPLVLCPVQRPAVLAFLNLVELHVLAAVRRRQAVSVPRMHAALADLRGAEGAPGACRHPLANGQLAGEELDPFVERYGELANLTSDARIVLRIVLRAALRRVERDAAGIPLRLHPYTRNRTDGAPAIVVIDPGHADGRPTLVGTGLTTALLAHRFKAGASLAELAREHGRTANELEEAIRYELRPAF